MGPQGPAGTGVSSFDDLDGLTCRVGTPEEGVLQVSYSPGGQATLQCLATALYELSVATTGNGTGSVTSNPTGISCGADCTESYRASTVVTLTAAPSGIDTFTGWSGACTGQNVTCQVTMDAARSVSAAFTDMTRIDVRVSNTIQKPFESFGTNSVTAREPYFVCAQTGYGVKDCSVNVPTGDSITFAAETGDTFEHWSSSIAACNDSTFPRCTFTVQAPAYLTGVFSE
jgi:hypothetical protein